jgi:thioredoxin reductase
MHYIVDTAVIGSGIAGLSAALFLGRACRSTTVFDGGTPRIYAVDEVREYLGFDAVPTVDVMARARTEVLRYGVEIRSEWVQAVTPRNDGLFDVSTQSGTIAARTVVLATGLTDELPPLNGPRKAWGRDVRVCPCFDGFEVRHGRQVVFGLGERLAHMASWVSMWSRNVTVVSRHALNDVDAEQLRLLGIDIISEEVTGLVHEGDQLVAVTTNNDNRIPCDATWIAMPVRAASGLAATLCDVDSDGFALTDPAGRTSRPGVFAIGNADEPWAHMAHAAASGTTVGPIVTTYLLEQRLRELRQTTVADTA